MNELEREKNQGTQPNQHKYIYTERERGGRKDKQKKRRGETEGGRERKERKETSREKPKNRERKQREKKQNKKSDDPRSCSTYMHCKAHSKNNRENRDLLNATDVNGSSQRAAL